MRGVTTIQRRLPWAAAGLWLAAGATTAAILPGAIAYGVMWSACRLNCSALGWLALTYAQGVGYLCAAVLISALGMRSYTLLSAKATLDQKGRLQPAFVLLAVAGALLMVGAPYLPPAHGYLSEMVKVIARHQ